MNLDWPTIDRWLIGEAWIGSKIDAHAHTLCQQIGPRWSSSPAEWEAIAYLQQQMRDFGLDTADREEFELQTWSYTKAEAHTADNAAIDLVPFNRTPSCALDAPLVNVGFGTPREIDAAQALAGSIAIMALAHEPFTTPIPHSDRLNLLGQKGAAAALCIDSKDGRRAEYHNAGDWREPERAEPPLPVATTSREHGALLQELAAQRQNLHLELVTRFYNAPSANVAGQLKGSHWPEEHLLLGGHHDTVYGTPGGNDNASGTIALLETARLLAGLRHQLGISPGRSIRFVTFAAEEQKFQGSSAYVQQHYGPETPPRLALNLDELSAGPIKGVVLAFDHLRDLVQKQLEHMGDGLQCHVMAQLDASSDHFPFLRHAIDAAHLWRWRFVGRHPDADYHHEAADTADKLNRRELREYAAQLARLLLRLSHLPPDAWPANPLDRSTVAQRLVTERGSVVRVF